MRVRRIVPTLARRLPALAITLAACALALALRSSRPAAPVPMVRRLPAQASARGLRPGLAGAEQMVAVGPSTASRSSAAAQATARAEASRKAAAALPVPRNVSPEILAQGQAKAGIQDRLGGVWTAGGARPGDTVDTNQPSISDPLAHGTLDLGPGTTAVFAYIEPYQEPDDWAYRNYCGPGAGLALLSHWDRAYAQKAGIDGIAAEMALNPYMGVWVQNMVEPINRHLNQIAGTDLNWYSYGRADSLDDFRYMLKTDLVDHGIPLITGLMTGGLPGWGYNDVGHFVAVYGYTRRADGSEYVSYADTAAPVSGHAGPSLHVWELNRFWQAISRNSGQVW